jgi:hypothetical protein
VSGHRPQAEALLNKISDSLIRGGAKKLRRNPGDPIVVFQFPNEQGRKVAAVAVYVLQNDLLVASDNVAAVEGISAALARGRSDSLASVPAYRATMSRCAAAAGTTPANLRWFIEPFGYAETLRADLPLRDRRKGPDFIKILRNQGFTAIQGLGGYINFSSDKYEVVHRTMIYAPALPGRNPASIDRYNLAARMLRFPSGGDLMPQKWVPADVATYISFNMDLKNAFAVVGTLVDDVVGEKGVFRDVLESLRDDPSGPQVDIEKSLVANLGQRVTLIADNVLPIGPKSERKVFAVEVTDEAKVAATIDKLMQSDKNARRREFDGFYAWEVVDPTSESPKLEIETPGLEMQHADSDAPAKRVDHDEHFLPTRIVSVTQGHIFLASHMELLQRVLEQSKAGELNQAVDFRMIADQMALAHHEPISVRGFSRTDLALRPTYELIRTGQMPQSETLLGKLLNSVMGDGKDGAPRKQKIDGHTLPEFEVIRHYFGPAGTAVSSLDDGWLCTGFAMANRADVATGMRPSDVQKR